MCIGASLMHYLVFSSTESLCTYAEDTFGMADTDTVGFRIFPLPHLVQADQVWVVASLHHADLPEQHLDTRSWGNIGN